MAIDSLSLRHGLERSPDWKAAQRAAEILHGGGFKCYLAGGSVRDALLGVIPSDFDVVTDAADEDLKKLFPKSFTVGKSFGVLVVPLEGATLEIAQFRVEGDYTDGRRPDSWQKATPKEDAGRRDFTVNALFYDMNSHQVIDYVGGLEDLKRRTLKCVGDPTVRLAEDKLRLFRAVRFVAQLGFQLEPATEKALRAASHEVFQVSPERRKEELMKLLRSFRPHKGVRWMAELGWLEPWKLGLEIYADEKFKDPVYGGSLRDNAYCFLKFMGKMKWTLERSKFWTEAHGGVPESPFADEIYVLALLLAPWRAVPTSQKQSFNRSVQKQLLEAHKFSSASSRAVAEGLEMLDGYYKLKETDRAFWEKASRSYVGVHLHELLGYEEEALKGERTNYEERAKNYEFKVRELPEPWVRGRDLKALNWAPNAEWGPALDECYSAQLNGKFQSPEQALEWVKSRLAPG